jgi:Spy/CpxP family protein refolding chaperone
MKLRIIISLFIFIFVFPTFLAFSQPSEMKTSPGMKQWWREAQCSRASDINLSQDQIKGLDLIQEAYFQEIRFLRIQLFSKRLELRDLLINPTLKNEAIRAKYREMNGLQLKLDEQTMEYLLKLRNLLTKEQLKTWCPEKEFSFLREMVQGPGLMHPMHPRKHPPEE